METEEGKKRPTVLFSRFSLCPIFKQGITLVRIIGLSDKALTMQLFKRSEVFLHLF